MTDRMDDTSGRISRPLHVAMGLAATLVGIARLRFAATEPLWFDEAFTLAIIAPPDWASFWREVYQDSNGPGYYLLARLWAGFSGHADLWLRMPSLLAVWIAALLPLVLPPKGMAPGARFTWAALIFCWWGIGFMLDARCYAVLLAISTGQCLAFARLMERPGLRRALVWATLGAAAILFHYYAVFLGLAQGLIYLARHRMAALRTWPAGLVLVPAVMWIAHHAPRLAEYSRLAAVWHRPIDPAHALGLVQFLFSASTPETLTAVVAILAISLLVARMGSTRPVGSQMAGPLVMTAGSGLLAFVLMMVFALTGAGITARYLAPLAPPILLGVVLVAGLGSRPGLTWLSLAGLYFGLLVGPGLNVLSPPRSLPRYEFETGAKFLMAHKVTDVVFVWDHELAPIMTSGTLKAVGGVFFARAHDPVRIIPLVLPRGQDPNREIIAAADGRHPGLIWVFNRAGHTAARDFAPAISRTSPDWTCDEQGDGTAGVLSCYRR